MFIWPVLCACFCLLFFLSVFWTIIMEPSTSWPSPGNKNDHKPSRAPFVVLAGAACSALNVGFVDVTLSSWRVMVRWEVQSARFIDDSCVWVFWKYSFFVSFLWIYLSAEDLIVWFRVACGCFCQFCFSLSYCFVLLFMKGCKPHANWGPCKQPQDMGQTSRKKEKKMYCVQQKNYFNVTRFDFGNAHNTFFA